jgi:hypothetical protein
MRKIRFSFLSVLQCRKTAFPIPVALSETRSYNCHEVKGVVVYPKKDNFYHACHGNKQWKAKTD